jgi:hypothetical protein
MDGCIMMIRAILPLRNFRRMIIYATFANSKNRNFCDILPGLRNHNSLQRPFAPFPGSEGHATSNTRTAFVEAAER